jgi:hypothetical protein
MQKDIIFYDNDADFVILDPDWDSLLKGLRQRLPRSYRVFYVVPSEDRSIKWIRVMTGVGIMDLVSGYVMLCYVMCCLQPVIAACFLLLCVTCIAAARAANSLLPHCCHCLLLFCFHVAVWRLYQFPTRCSS